MSKTSNFFKTNAILSTALLSLLGACAIDDPIDYTTSPVGPSSNQDANNESFLSFAGVFAQDEAEVNTERRIQFSIDETIDANKEYSVTVDGNEFKYTTTSSPDHQTLASQLAQAIDSNALYSATAENNVIRILDGAGTSSISAMKAGTLTDISEDPPTEPLMSENLELIDVGLYYGNSNRPWKDYLSIIEQFYRVEKEMTTVNILTRLNGSDPMVSLLVVYLPGNPFNQSEIESLQKILQAGGRIFFIGEHQSYTPTENKIISDAIVALGGSIVVKTGSYSDDYHDREGIKNLYNSPLNAGVSRFHTNYYAELEIDPSISQAVVVSDNKRIVIADQALLNGRITLIADHNWMDNDFDAYRNSSDAKIFLGNLAIDAFNNEKKVQDGIDPNENFAPSAGTVETIYTSVASFNINGETLTIKSTNGKIGKDIQFQKQNNGESKVEYKDEKLVITYKENVSTTEDIVALLNAYPEFSATTTGNIIIP